MGRGRGCAAGEGPMMPTGSARGLEGWVDRCAGAESCRAAQCEVKATEADFRFTVGAGALYVFGYVWPGAAGRLRSASLAAGKAYGARGFRLLGGGVLKFRQTAAGLAVESACDGGAGTDDVWIEGGGELCRVWGCLRLAVGGRRRSMPWSGSTADSLSMRPKGKDSIVGRVEG